MPSRRLFRRDRYHASVDDRPQTIPANLFAEYAPRAAGEPRTTVAGLVIRTATLADRDALAQIAWQRNGGRLEEFVERFQRDLNNQGNPIDALWLAAEVEGCVVGYGKVSYLTPAAGAPPNAAPAGYYLGGVTVSPDFRRMGIGLELTRQRLSWITLRASEAFYFANAQNRPSIDLHAKLGFVELTRDFFVPGATFAGGVGILFRVELRSV
jgi:predicted N-acetyltransferase YhbS